MNDDYLEKFQNFTFNKYLDMHSDEISWCPTAGFKYIITNIYLFYYLFYIILFIQYCYFIIIGCKYAFLYDGKNSDYTCPICSKNYCLNCRV